MSHLFDVGLCVAKPLKIATQDDSEKEEEEEARDKDGFGGNTKDVKPQKSRFVTGGIGGGF